MASATLTGLPVELLDRIYWYLDDEQSMSDPLNKPNIKQISLTCHRLREAVLPTLFRDAVLKLRWFDGMLAEPTLVRFLSEAPQLAKHVRSVYITPVYGHSRAENGCNEHLAIPEDSDDWLPYAISQSDDRNAEHRARIDDLAKEILGRSKHEDIVRRSASENRSLAAEFIVTRLCEWTQRPRGNPSYIPPTPATPRGPSSRGGRRRGLPRGALLHHHPIAAQHHLAPPTTAGATTAVFAGSYARKGSKQTRDLWRELDALVIVMLCFPLSITSLYFDAHPRTRPDGPEDRQNAFVFQIVSTAVEVFGSHIQQLAMVATSSAGDRLSSFHWDVHSNGDACFLAPAVLEKLSRLESLVLAAHTDVYCLSGRRFGFVQHHAKWHILKSTVVRLTLRNVFADSGLLRELIGGFDKLRMVSLDHVLLEFNGQKPTLSWLEFLIELRRARPELQLDVGEALPYLFSLGQDVRFLRKSAISWLLDEAIPTGHGVDWEREMRLVEDFQSFLPLWSAEDSVRGEQAKQARVDGKLVDDAMASRWKTFSNERRVM